MFLNCQRADSFGRRTMEGRRVGAEPSSNTWQDNTAKANLHAKSLFWVVVDPFPAIGLRGAKSL
jgi:hypothetical protein